MPMVSKRVSASASGSASTTIAGRTKLWVTRPRRHRGRPKSAPWICRCAWTTLARRPQLHRANNSGRWFESDQEKERPSPYERTPAVLGLGSTAALARLLVLDPETIDFAPRSLADLHRPPIRDIASDVYPADLMVESALCTASVLVQVVGDVHLVSTTLVTSTRSNDTAS